MDRGQATSLLLFTLLWFLLWNQTRNKNNIRWVKPSMFYKHKAQKAPICIVSTLEFSKLSFDQGIQKGESSLFVNASMGRLPFWGMEASYCTPQFGAVIQGELRILSLSHVLPCMSLSQSSCVHDSSPHNKDNTCLTNLLGWQSYEKIGRYNNSPPYMMVRWRIQSFFFIYFQFDNMLTHFLHSKKKKKKKLDSG